MWAVDGNDYNKTVGKDVDSESTRSSDSYPHGFELPLGDSVRKADLSGGDHSLSESSSEGGQENTTDTGSHISLPILVTGDGEELGGWEATKEGISWKNTRPNLLPQRKR